MVEESALDVTRRHAARMAQALHQAVVTFLSSAPLDREESPVVRTLAAVASGALRRHSLYSVLSVE